MVIPTARVPEQQPATLTPDDIAKLRASVSTAASRRKWSKPPHWRTYRGGPLDGLKAALDDYDIKCWSYGWCQMTGRGCVQVLYRVHQEELVFDRLTQTIRSAV